MKVHHGLVCMFHGSSHGKIKTCQSRSNPSLEDLKVLYEANLRSALSAIEKLKSQGGVAMRVSSDLFPLATHKQYRDRAIPWVEDLLKQYANEACFEGMHLSLHPDQYVLLTSVQEEVNQNALFELECWARWSQWFPWTLINIHGGSKSLGEAAHRKIFEKNLNKASARLQSLLSLENDEKSYSAQEMLDWAESFGLMMVLDFHHEKCLVGKTIHREGPWKQAVMESLVKIFPRIEKTYEGKKQIPLFHISSPSQGWNGIFKDECKHHETIQKEDYPFELQQGSWRECILDIEAKHKESALGWGNFQGNGWMWSIEK